MGDREGSNERYEIQSPHGVARVRLAGMNAFPRAKPFTNFFLLISITIGVLDVLCVQCMSICWSPVLKLSHRVGFHQRGRAGMTHQPGLYQFFYCNVNIDLLLSRDKEDCYQYFSTGESCE